MKNEKIRRRKDYIIFIFSIIIYLSSCASPPEKDLEGEEIKIVGNAYLYNLYAWPPEKVPHAYTWNSNKELISINLSHSRVNKKQLSLISKSQFLEEAILRHTDIEDKQLVYLINAKNLEKLSLASTNITNDGVRFLEQLKKLSWLDLSKTNITKESIERLQKILPKTKIDF